MPNVVPARQEAVVYQPKDAIGTSIKSTLIMGGAGTLVSAVQNALTKQNVTAWGVFTRTGGTIAIFGLSDIVAAGTEPIILTPAIAAMGGTYEFARTASANLREKNDSWNPALGGFLAGAILGFRCQLLHIAKTTTR